MVYFVYLNLFFLFLSQLLAKLPKYQRLVSKLNENGNLCFTPAGFTLADKPTVATVYTKLHPTSGESPACLKILEKDTVDILKTEATTRKRDLTSEITIFYKGAQATCDNACQL